jgi:hypothetical protein
MECNSGGVAICWHFVIREARMMLSVSLRVFCVTQRGPYSPLSLCYVRLAVAGVTNNTGAER